MKKFLILLSLLAATLTASYGQTVEHPKNILGVRAGIGITGFGYGDSELSRITQSKVGFVIEVVDQIRLSKKLPFYLETGLFVAEKGASQSAVLDIPSSFSSLYYVGVPLTINYRWAIAKKFALEPQLGFYYAFLAGASTNGTDTMTDFTGMNRSDFGLRVGVSAIYANTFSLRLGYDAGFISTVQANPYLPTITNGSFTIALGINFNLCK